MESERKTLADAEWNHRHRLNAFVQRMQSSGLDQLVLYYHGMHSFLDENYVLLLSGFKAMGESLLVLDLQEGMTLFLSPPWDAARARQQLPDASVIGTDDVSAAFREWIGPRPKAPPERIGFIGLTDMNARRYNVVSSVLGGELREVKTLFKDLSRVKTEEELELARKATWIAERGFEKMLEVVRPGMYDYQMAGELVSYMKSLGADDNFLLMSASLHNQAVRPPGKRRLERGDIILAEISPSVQGQFSQICRSAVLGGTDRFEEIKEKYDLLVHAMRQGMTAAKPGAPVADVVKAVNAPIEAAGYGKYCAPPYMRVRGHGLGLSSLLPGDISADNDTVLEEGMFFVLHPNQYIPETGYLLCGEPVVITKDGAKPLTSRMSSLVNISI